MSQNTEVEYVLGTGSDELQRLALQHRAWSAQALQAWERAGFGPGHRVLDLGCGPGYATLDLAQVVGAEGKIFARDLSSRFIEHLRHTAEAMSLAQIDAQVGDAAELEGIEVDFAWCRWVLMFVPQPSRALAAVRQALRPGGKFVLHEYISYHTMRMAPFGDHLDEVIEAIRRGWEAQGAEMNLGLRLPGLLAEAGFAIRHVEPIIRMARPGTLLWQWPRTFFDNFLPRLVAAGHLDPKIASAFRDQWARCSRDPHGLFLSPAVLEIVAEKPADR